jgi:hypothetical protein
MIRNLQLAYALCGIARISPPHAWRLAKAFWRYGYTPTFAAEIMRAVKELRTIRETRR